MRRPPRSTLFPYTPPFRSNDDRRNHPEKSPVNDSHDLGSFSCMAKPVHIGCAGWNYRDWRGPIYPDKLPARLWLEHRSEEHTSELQSQSNLVCRLLLEKKK